MAAKLLRSLTDDNPDLQKQIGCMTGIFQIFDRQNMITPKRITGHNLKRHPNGDSHFSGSALEAESNTTYVRSMPMEKHSRRHVLEKQKISTESSRASFSSSSRSSSFSSLDFNKSSQQDSLSFDRITFPENPSKDAVMSQPSVSSQLGRQSLDLRDVVKDSMYRESQGLPVRTTPKHEAVDSHVKLRDSPRPLNLSRGNGETYGLSFSRKEESVKVPAKLREAPRFVNEPRELSRSASYHSKDGSFYSMAKEAPRFSYDGKDSCYGLYESRENSKSSLKPPRLSLDSRESSMRSLKSDSQPELFLKSLRNDSVNSIHPQNQRQTSGSQARPPSVVAKLMGLEAMPRSDIPDEMKTSSSKKRTVEDSSGFSRTPSTTEPSGPIKIAIPSKALWKETGSPRWKVPDSSITPVSRLPMEPAPWKQVDGNRKSPKAIKGVKSPVRNQNMFPTVFGEIEKRLKDLEFSQSAKDLRALKQILEAMQAKGLLESQKEEDSSFATKRDLGRISNSIPPSDSRKPQNDQDYASAKRGNNFSRNYESPIVIMKPAKLFERSGVPASSAISMEELSNLPRVQGAFVDSRNSVNSRTTRGQVPKSNSRDNVSNDIKSNNRTSRTTQTSARSSQNAKEGNSRSLKVSGSISPRMHQKKQESDKRSRPPMSPSDSGRKQRPSNKQGTESSSPGGRRRPKTSVIQQNDDQLSDISNESRHLSYQGNEYSAQSDGSIISESPMDIEVDSLERTPEVDNRHIPSMKTANNLVSCLIEKKSTLLCHEDEVPMEQSVIAPEYPSPVSVLDNVLDIYDSPSPVKHKIKTTRGEKSNEYDSLPCSEQQDIPGVGSLTNAVSSVPTSEINRKKLQKIESLVLKLQRLNSTHDEVRTDYIASLCENKNPDHRYISEILLASGLLLSDLDSSLTYFQFHPSGHPINPELFLVLEQTKASTFFKDEPDSEKTVQLRSKQKVHRKLIFDTINEVLVSKLASSGLSSEPWMVTPQKLSRKTLNAQKLLRELCLETEELQSMVSKCSSEDEDDGLRGILWEDVMHRSESWTDCSNDVSGLVLDIERLVFKDLINDIVIGEAPSLENKHVRRRQLFAK